jgi:O-antigen/teichoic acid export membrane protein
MKFIRRAVEFLGFMLLGAIIGLAVNGMVIGLFVGIVLHICVLFSRNRGRNRRTRTPDTLDRDGLS